MLFQAYNEEESIGPLIECLNKALCGALLGAFTTEVIIVDDGSTDGTWERILSLQDSSRCTLRTYRCTKNRGQSYAIMKGGSLAQGRFIATLDADLQCDPESIGLLMTERHSFDCVIGRRQRRQDLFWKRALSWVANTVRRLFIDDNTFDSGSSVKLFKRECLSVVPHFRGVHRLLPAYFVMAGYRVGEISVPHLARQYGTSKYSLFSRGISVLMDFLATAWLFHRGFRDQEG